MRCRGLQRLANPAYLGGFLFSALLRVAPCIALAVVSEWYQKVTSNAFEVTIPNERSIYTLGVFSVRGATSSLDRYHVLPRGGEWT